MVEEEKGRSMKEEKKEGEKKSRTVKFSLFPSHTVIFAMFCIHPN